MSPLPQLLEVFHSYTKRAVLAKPTDPHGLVLEAWSQGFMVGALIIMSCITLANMRRGVLLHKLILLELVLGYWQGFWLFFNPPIDAWWLSVAAIPLNISWSIHNVIAWMKLKPFLSKNVSRLFIGSVILVQPYWVVEIYANFTFFHNINDVFLKTRPWEALCRDPWWLAAVVFLIYNIKTKYDLTLTQIVRISPRFAVMLGAMMFSVIFIILDVCSVTSALKSALPVGINPFWKLSFVFKCLTDSVVLDDFKTALDRLRAFKMSRLGSFAIDGGDSRSKQHHESVVTSNDWADPPPKGDTPSPVGNVPLMPSPDGDYIQEPHWDEAKSGSSNHIENEKLEVPKRDISRDRDSDEHGIDTIDHDATHREASDAHMIQQQQPWPQRANNNLDLDDEYAMAMREMTNTSTTKTAKKFT